GEAEIDKRHSFGGGQFMTTQPLASAHSELRPLFLNVVLHPGGVPFRRIFNPQSRRERPGGVGTWSDLESASNRTALPVFSSIPRSRCCLIFLICAARQSVYRLGGMVLFDSRSGAHCDLDYVL